MKNIITKFFAKVAMVACLATAFAGSALAQSSIEINTTNSGVTGSYQDKEFDVDGITFKFTQWMKNTNIQAKKSTTNSLYNIDAIPGTITSIVVVQTGTPRAITVYGGTSEKPTTQITSPSTAATMTFDFTGKVYNYFSLTTPGNACYFDSITINYTPSGSSSAAATTTTINASGITNTDVHTSTAAGSLSASVTVTEGGTAVSGATVTWSGNNDAVATINANTGVVTLVSAGTVKFTASYAGESGVYEASSAEYTMTVTSSAPYTQPTEFDIIFNDSFFGTNYGGSAAGITDDNPISGTQDNVTVTYAGGGNHYVSSNQIRFYPSNKLTFEAPSGYEIKSIVFTQVSGGNWAATISANSGTYTSGTKTWEGAATSVLFTGSGSGRCDMAKATITLGLPSSVTAPTFSPADGTTFGNDGLDVTISADSGTIYYTLDGSAPTTESSVYSNAIHITATTTVKAIAVDGSDVSSVASATYTYVNPNGPGTQNNPYTVAQARAAIDNGTGVTGVYVTGIVSGIVEEYNATYHNISYNISADGTTTADQLEAYRGKGVNGADFTSADDIQVGDEVVVFGNLTKYGSTYELASGNELVSLNRPVTPIIVAEDVTIAYDATSGEIPYSISNASEATLAATCAAEWISNITVTPTKVTFTATANEGNTDRTATFTLTYTGATSKTVTVTQAHYVADYATLPFEYDGNGSNPPTGFTLSGVGTYSSSPAMKFDGTGDYAILKINERPGTLTFDIKNNSFSGGTFKVQTSEDGSIYTDLVTYTEITGTQKEEFNNLAENVRYIKWIYTEKSSGNVALGNVKLAKYVDPSAIPSITVTPNTATPAADDVSGTLEITYANLTITDMTDFDVQYCDSEGADASQPSWVDEILVAAKDPSEGEGYVVSFTIQANNGAARSAYFKIYALDDDTNIVYSNLVTITQDAAPVIGYATLPFEFDGGRADIAETSGLTQEGLDSDYNSSPKLKFNGTGDVVVLQINEAPNALTFDIKGNSFSDGTFTVLTSADGENYTALAAYTDSEIGQSTSLSESFDNLDANIRFIKWEYTEKVNGNVALGNIRVTKPASDPATVTLTAKFANGHYWTTYYNGTAKYSLSDGAQAFIMNDSHQLYLLGDGDVIPKGNAVIIISDTATITLTKVDASGSAVSGNILLGSDSPIATYTITTGIPYVLSITDDGLGFYEFTGSGIPANKAYYVE